jgi:hypothetical protein
MADTKSSKDKDMNKSEEIRKIAAAMKAKGEKPRPVTIIEVLRKQGVEVSSPQVSMVLKRMGFRPRRRRKSGGTEVGAAKSTTKAVRVKKASNITIEDLMEAKKVVSALGGVDRALATLEALRKFENT